MSKRKVVRNFSKEADAKVAQLLQGSEATSLTVSREALEHMIRMAHRGGILVGVHADRETLYDEKFDTKT